MKNTNVWYTGNLNTSSDVDCYQINLLEDGYVALEFRVPRQTRDNQVEISLCDSNLKVLDSDSNTGNPYIKTKTIFRPAGTYYVRVKSGNYFLGFNDDYSFCLNYQPLRYVTEITLPQCEKMKVGSKVTLTPSIFPENATDKNVSWSTSNRKVATVSGGLVTAKTPGTAIITVKAMDGSEQYAQRKVTVGYSIKYYLKGGKNNSNNPFIYYNEKITLKNLTRKGYLFKGWYTDKGYKNKITKITKNYKKNLTLYAKWEKVSVGKPSISTLKNIKSSKASLKYKAVSKAAGYEIVYSTSAKFNKKYTNVLVTTKKSVTLKNLTKKKTYYVKVRAYKRDSTGKKVYGKYSAVKKVTIKK